MKLTKLMFVQIYVCTMAICLGFSIYTGITEKARQSNIIIVSVMFGFVFVSILFVGAVGILGALLSQISKSRREFALRLVCGATKFQIIKGLMFSWLFKIAILPVATGLFTVFGLLLALKDLTQQAIGIELQSNFYIYGFSFMFVVIFSFFVAIYPACKAANTDILKTLAG